MVGAGHGEFDGEPTVQKKTALMNGRTAVGDLESCRRVGADGYEPGALHPRQERPDFGPVDVHHSQAAQTNVFEQRAFFVGHTVYVAQTQQVRFRDRGDHADFG
jgi:hypothetical protein